MFRYNKNLCIFLFNLLNNIYSIKKSKNVFEHHDILVLQLY